MLEGLMVQIFKFISFPEPEILSFARQIFISNLSIFAQASIQFQFIQFRIFCRKELR